MQGPAACRYRKLLHDLAVDLCVSPPRRMRHGGAFTRLHFSTPHFPSQHVANNAHARCTQLPSIARARSRIYRGDRCHGLNTGAQANALKNIHVEFSHRNILIPTERQMENTQEKKVHRRPSAGTVGAEGCRITGRPWGPKQVICLKHEQTEHTLT